MSGRWSFLAVQKLRKPRKLLIGAGVATAVGLGTYISTPPELAINPDNVGFVRFGRAYSAVARIVTDYKWSLYRVPSPSEEYDLAIKDCHSRSAKRLLDLAERNGGVFIKVGQHIAAMEYLIPPEYTKTLSVLMSKAPQQSMEDVRFVIESELGGPIEMLFAEFSEKPIGAASLAQVHTAISPDGQKLAVKVQHRKVYQNSLTDMKTMEILAKVADKCFPEFRLLWLVEEVKKNLPNELDFLHEARNMERARKVFAHLDFLKIPKSFPELTSKRVLTMEFCEGSQVDDIEYLKKNKIDRHEVAKKLGRLIAEMIFIKGFLHADPHPGNVLVRRKRSGKPEIVLLDHGLYLDVTDRFRNMYSDLWMGILNADQKAIKKVANEMGIGEYYGLFACMVTRRSWKSVTSGIGKSQMTSAEKQELREYAYSLIPQISDVMSRMPREMVLILKTNDLLRNMEHILGCHGRQDSILEVTKCVIRCHHEMSLRHTRNLWESFSLRVSLIWSIFRLRLYELFLIVKDDLGYA